MASDSPAEKASLTEAEYDKHSRRTGEVLGGPKDVTATPYQTTLASFAHLDEKKILRKVTVSDLLVSFHCY